MKTLFLAAAAAALLAFPAVAQEDGEAGFTRPEIEQIVRDYLLQNPEIMYEIQAALEKKQREEQQSTNRQIISQASDQIFASPHDGIIGNPDGEVTVVEFFDYNCGYCKRAMSDMQALVAENPDLRFVLKEFPVLGPDSQQAHVVSMAFRALAPEKYPEFHTRLLGSEGRATEDSAIALAVELGVEEAALREEMENPEIAEAIGGTYALADQLQITGTPSYVVGQEVVIGALGKDVLVERIEAARQ